MPETHHIYGPSTLKSREICPGWTNDKDADTSRADEGTLLHKKTETEDLSGLTKEQETVVRLCIEAARKLVAGSLKHVKEARLDILNGLTFGTSDLVVLKKMPTGKLRVIVSDWKFGYNMVDDAEINRQGWAYLLGAMALWPEAEEGEIRFYLPRLGAVSRHVFTKDDLPRLAFTIRLIVERCMEYAAKKGTPEGDAMLNPVAENCEYCGDKLGCAKARSFFLTSANKYEPLEIVEVHSSAVTDPAQMVKLYRAAKVLERMVGSVYEHARRMAAEHGGLFDENGTKVFELASRAAPRKIKNLPAAVEVFREMGLSDAEILTQADVSLPGCLDLLAEQAPRGQKAKLRGVVETKLQEADAISYGEPVYYLKKTRE